MENLRFWFSITDIRFTDGCYAQMTVVLSSILTQSCDCPPVGHCPGLIISVSALVSESSSAEATATSAGAGSPHSESQEPIE